MTGPEERAPGTGRAADEAIVAWQIGRTPRSPFRVATRCVYGRPRTIASPSRLDDGNPFPTLYWLTCPWLIDLVSDEESAGGAAAWAQRLEEDWALGKAQERADAEYRARRAEESSGEDACASVGVGGQARPLGTKCLHAHVAAFLSGIHDMVGEGVLAGLPFECPDDRCGKALEELVP